MPANSNKNILFYISGHGFGHLGQCIPIIEHLHQAHKSWQFFICSAIPEKHLHQHIDAPIQVLPQSFDFGMIMEDAFRVDKPATLLQFQNQLDHWQEEIEKVEKIIEEIKADLVLNNVSYLLPLAARQFKIPCITFSSLNWYDIAKDYFPDQSQLLEKLKSGYEASSCFFNLTPGMGRSWNGPMKEIGPVAKRGYALDLNEICKTEQQRFVLVSMGGIPFDIDFSNWPEINNVIWLTAQDFSENIAQCYPVPNPRPDIKPLPSFDISYSNALASCDLLLTKPGYGNFVEAACMGKPILYVPRDDWPEQPFLLSWIEANTISLSLSEINFIQGSFKSQVAQLLRGNYPAKSPTGISEFTQELNRYI